MSPRWFLDSRPRGFDNRPVRTTVVLAALCLVTACKRHPAGERTCGEVGHRFYELGHAEVETSTELTPAERTGVRGLLAPMRDSMVRACTEDHWTAAARACFAAAADQQAFYACDAQLTPEQRAILAQRAAGKGK